jgi:hypothetical protein
MIPCSIRAYTSLCTFRKQNYKEIKWLWLQINTTQFVIIKWILQLSIYCYLNCYRNYKSLNYIKQVMFCFISFKIWLNFSAVYSHYALHEFIAVKSKKYLCRRYLQKFIYRLNIFVSGQNYLHILKYNFNTWCQWNLADSSQK